MTVNLDEFDNAIRLASAFGGHVVAVDASVLRALVDEVKAARSGVPAADPRPLGDVLDMAFVRGSAGARLRVFDDTVREAVRQAAPNHALPGWAKDAYNAAPAIRAAAAKERTRLEAVVRGDPLALGDAVAEYRATLKGKTPAKPTEDLCR